MRGTSTMGPSVDQPAISLLHWPSLRRMVLPGGLHLNRAKSLLHTPVGDPLNHNPLPADIPSTRGGFDLLGSPIGPASHCESTVLKRVKKVQEILAKLGDLQDSQMETTLLRSCFALPKVAFALRTSPPSHTQQATVVFDNAMLKAPSDLAGGPLPEWAWLKASLPSFLGGLNIRRASLHAPAAYISSLDQSKLLVARILGRIYTGGLPTPGSCPFGPGHCC